MKRFAFIILLSLAALVGTANRELTPEEKAQMEQIIHAELQSIRRLAVVVSSVTVIIVVTLVTLYLFDKKRHERLMISMAEQLREKDAQLQTKTQQNQTLLRMLHNTRLDEGNHDVADIVRLAAEGRHSMTPADWARLYHAVDTLRPHFKAHILERLGSATEQQLQVCYLLALGLTNTQIRNITDMTSVTVWRWTKRFAPLLAEEPTTPL